MVSGRPTVAPALRTLRTLAALGSAQCSVSALRRAASSVGTLARGRRGPHVTGGYEISPTVRIGGRYLPNPSLSQVQQAIRRTR